MKLDPRPIFKLFNGFGTLAGFRDPRHRTLYSLWFGLNFVVITIGITLWLSPIENGGWIVLAALASFFICLLVTTLLGLMIRTARGQGAMAMPNETASSAQAEG